jgi:tetratricopeptide (TPR) repeat protein
VTDESERQWLRPHLRHLLGLDDGEGVAHEQLFAAWRTFFERIAERGTVILIFEDLHWADPGLIDFIEHLVDWARDAPLAIVTLARPELMDRRPNWGAGQRRFTSVHLEPLDEEDMRLLLKSVASDLPVQVGDAIVERAEGIPLYAVEMVRVLVDKGDLVPEGGAFRWVGSSEQVDVPDSLHSLIASRLDALGLDDRLLVQDAAVLGKTFTTGSLAALSTRSADDLDSRLKDLARREILVVDTDPRSPERGQYGFVQSLIREVAYQTLSNKDRKARHLAAAHFFTSLDEADLIDVVATHYVEAFKNAAGDDDAAEIGRRARTTLAEAAERAGSLGSHEQATALLMKALDIAEEPAERGRLLCKAGIASAISAHTEEAIEHLTAGIELLRDAGEADLRARAQAQLGTAYFLLSRLDEAEKMLEEAVDELEDTETGSAATILVEAARIQAFKGNFERCERFSAQAMPAAERSERLDLIAEALITRAVSSILSGRPHEAEALLSGALKLAEDNDLVPQQMRALLNIGANQLSIHPRLSMATAQRAMELARHVGSREQEAFALANAVESSVHLGGWDYFRRVMLDADEYSFGAGALGILYPAAAVGEAYAGNLEVARRYADEYERSIGDTTSVQDIGYLTGSRCAIALVEGDFEAVIRLTLRDHHDETYEHVAPHGVSGRAALWSRNLAALENDLERRERSSVRTTWLRTLTRTLEAGLAALRGDDEAPELYDRVLTQWNELDIPLGRALCQMDRALVLGDDPATAAEAEAFFVAAGNELLVRRLQEVRSG